MTHPTVSPASTKAPQANEREAVLAFWKQRIRELPDVRREKVQATRSALQQRAYDAEAILDATIQEMGNDIGVLCRHDGDPSPTA